MHGFARFCADLAIRLPFGLSHVVAPTFVGFAIINGSTFALDLLLLAVLHGWWAVPLPVALTVAYTTAFGVSFVVNRVLNFRSHGPITGQVASYVLVVVANYVAFILGVSTLLSDLGSPYLLSRLVAGACEAAFMYSAMRWVVFRPR